MGSRLILPLILVAALIASGLFFWFSSTARRADSGPERPQHERVASAEDERGDLARPSGLAEAPVAEASERVVVEEPMLEPSPREGAPANSGTSSNLRGRVVDRFGAPVSRARVAAREESGFWFEPDGGGGRVGTETDAEGDFELDVAFLGGLRLEVRAAGFAPYNRSVELRAGDALDLGAIAISEGAILSGRVIDSAGRPVADAELLRIDDAQLGGFILQGGRRESAARSARDGSFRIDELACGPWKILVRSENHPERMFEGIAEDPGVEVAGLVFELEPGTAISGWATGIPGDERGKLSVRAVKVAADEASPSPPSLGARTVPLDAEGRFSVLGLEVGATYELRLLTQSERAGAFAPFGRSRSETSRAQAGDTGVVLAYLPEAAISFQVLDAATKKPLERFEVEAGIGFPEALRGEDGRILRLHPEGRVRVGNLRPEGEERVELTVHATGYEDLREQIALSRGQELELGPIFLERVPRVLVEVSDARTGDPIPGARVTLVKDTGNALLMDRRIEVSSEDGVESQVSFGERTAVTDEQGSATLTSFEGETCRLSVQADGFARAELGGLFLPKGKDVEQSFALTRGGEVLVSVLDLDGNPLSGARVRHRPPSERAGPLAYLSSGSEDTDSEGRAHFKSLEPGIHGFQLDESRESGGVFMEPGAIVLGGSAGGEWSEVEVQEDGISELVLRASPRGGLTGRVREAGSALPGASIALAPRGEERSERGFMPFGNRERARTDGHGEYRYEDLKAGPYTLTIEHPARSMPAVFEVDIDEGRNRFDVELPVSILEGRVTDVQGRPLAGISVRAERVRETGERRDFIAISVMDDGDGEVVTLGDGLGASGGTTDSEGRYSLRGVASDVDLVVKAQGEGVQEGSSEVVSVGPDETRSNVDLELEPAGSIEVEALLADGSPAQMCLVRARYLADEGVRQQFGFIQSRSTKLDGLRPGTWRLNVERAGPGRSEEDGGIEQDVEVRAGELARATIQVE